MVSRRRGPSPLATLSASAPIIVCAWIGAAATNTQVDHLGPTATSNAQDGDTHAAAEIYKGFHLSPGDCGGSDADCDLRKPKQWTREERSIIAGAVDEILKRPSAASIIRLAQQRGARDLRRYSMGVVASQPQPAIAAELRRGQSDPGINIYDRFFADSAARDLYSGHPGYLLLAERLLHECFHAIDEWSAQPRFRAAIGFVSMGGRPLFTIDNSDDATTLTTWDSDLRKLEAEHDYAAEWRLNRSFAFRMRPVRVPSMRSISSPAEAFAELGSHLVLDPRARIYLTRPVVEYFDGQVFPELRRPNKVE